MNIIYTAKSIGTKEYISVKSYGLEVAERILKGNGTHNEPYEYGISVTNNGVSDWTGIFHMEICEKRHEPQIFMPAFMYSRNRGDTPAEGMRMYPRLSDEFDRPRSPYFKVRGDRLSHPAVIMYDNGKMMGISASPYWTLHNNEKQDIIGREYEFYRYAGYSCNLNAKTDGEDAYCSVGYTLGYENSPWLFIDSQTVVKEPFDEKNCFVIKAGEIVKFKVYIYEFNTDNITDINRIIENTYYRYHEPHKPKTTIKEAVRDIAGAIYEDAWIEADKCYSLFVFDTDNEQERFRKLGSVSWTNGLSVAVPVLMSAVRLNNESMKEQALTCINNIISNCMNESSSLPYDAYSDGRWSVHGWWYNGMKTGGHCGYLTGQAVYYVLKAYEYMKKYYGKEYKEWLAFAKRIIDRTETAKNSDGEYPYILSEKTGAGLEYDSFGSVWCMTAAAYYMQLTKDYSYLEGVKKSEKHYYDDYVKKCVCYGGPMDISKGVDSEGILAYIRAVKFIHQITKDDIYLKHMKDGTEYEFTFKFCYATPVKIPPLSKTGWSGCGGSVTSVVNPHIHPMSSTVVDELLYYAEHTGDEYINERIKDVLLWGCQTYNHYDKEYDYGKRGWMSERYCYCEGLLTEKYPDGSPASTWFALMPWAGASIIEGMTGDIWDRLDKNS